MTFSTANGEGEGLFPSIPRSENYENYLFQRTITDAFPNLDFYN